VLSKKKKREKQQQPCVQIPGPPKINKIIKIGSKI
jgi:hypothetical protein